MSGLFGIAVVNPAVVKCDLGRKDLFAKMARALQHRPGLQVDRWVSPDGSLLVGRIGYPHVNRVAWPSEVEWTGNGVKVFCAGILHGNGFPDNRPSLSALAEAKSLRGFYSVVLRREYPSTTVVVADRRASFPLFYAETTGLLFFASQVKALLVCSGISREFDRSALGTFLATGHLVGDQTLHPTIRRLRGGRLLRVEGGRIIEATYWRFAPGSALTGEKDAELEEELSRLVTESAARNIGDPNGTVLFLSGGVDSRGVLGGCLAAMQGEASRLNTVTWGKDHGAKDSDVQVAALIADAVGVKHQFIRREVNKYEEDFSQVNYLIDALSDIAAHHPHEFRIMEALRRTGFERVLRGDEVFGWSFSAKDAHSAMALVGLSRLRDHGSVADILRPGLHRDLCDAADAAIDTVLAEVEGLAPNEAKDYLYFSHRLQCYLHTASYYKQYLLDQRNCLLDESILDFMSRVPTRVRVDKVLYRRMVARAYPLLGRFPFAKLDNLENWTLLLTCETPVRSFVLTQLEDHDSSIWDYFDPLALRGMLDLLTARASSLERHPSFRRGVRDLFRRAVSSLPRRVINTIQARRTHAVWGAYPEQVLMRVMVLKNYCDSLDRIQ